MDWKQVRSAQRKAEVLDFGMRTDAGLGKAADSIAQQHGQLSNWPQRLDGDQTGLSWRTTDACLGGERSRAVLRLDVR